MEIRLKMEVEGSAVAEDLVKIGGGEYGATLSGLFGESVAYVTDIPVTEQSQATELAGQELDRLARQLAMAPLRSVTTMFGQDLWSNFRAFQKGKMASTSSLPRRDLCARSGYLQLTFRNSNTMGT